MSSPMRSSSRFKTSLFARDPSRRAHFIHASSLGSGAHRFHTFQSWLLAQEDTPQKASLVLGCLLSFEGIASDTDLRAAYNACSLAARFDHTVRIDWRSENGADSRHLSDFTILMLRGVVDWSPFDVAKTELLQELTRAMPYCDGEVCDPALWDQLLKDGMAWLQTTLPSALYGHVCGANRMTALPRTALARETTQLALKPEVGPTEQPGSPNHNIYIRAFDAAMLGHATKSINSSSFVDRLTKALRPPTKGAANAKRNAVLSNLRSLAVELESVDETCALLYLFALDLTENGTHRKRTLATTTPSDYVGSFAHDFQLLASGKRLYGIDETTYADIYRKLLGNTQHAAPYRVAGLRAFHLFLRAWWQVPRLPTDVSDVDTDTAVAANIVWPHELSRLNDWLDNMEPHRFFLQLKAALAIAGHAPIRARELLVLRLINVIDEGDHVVIEVAREIRDGSEKTSEGRRRLTIRDEEAIKPLRAWLTRRADEAATSQDYLFGDPTQDQSLCHAGRLYFWLNRLLKSATGDESISLHTLRHSVASQRFAAMLADEEEHDVNPLDVLANDAGHVGAHITLLNYCHLYEAGLRQALDRGLLALPLSYAAVASWSDVKEATLRQRVHRAKARGSPAVEPLWQTIRERAARVSLPVISEKIALATADNPLLPPATLLSFAKVAGMLRDVAQGLSTAQSALRQDVSETIVRQAIEIVGDFADRHGKGMNDMPDLLTLGVNALRDASGRQLGMRPDLARLAQSRWTLLARAIARIDTVTLSYAVQYWQRALQRHHLAVRPGAGWDAFVSLLRAAEINTSLMAIKHAILDTPSHSDMPSSLALAQATARLRLGRSLQVIPCSQRPGRPPIWLVIVSDVTLLDKDGSAQSMAGLHGAMLIAHVWLSLSGSH